VALNTHPAVSPLIENVTVNTPSGRHWVARGQGDCAWGCPGNPAPKARKMTVRRHRILIMIQLCCTTATRRRDIVLGKPGPEGAVIIPQCVLCPHPPVTPNAPIWVNASRFPAALYCSRLSKYSL